MKKISIFLFIFIRIVFSVFSQGTIKVMAYNLLNFNNYTSYCTQSNNNHFDKAAYLKTIVKNQNPDLLLFCELGTNISATYTTNYILGNSLNVDGETKWRAGSPTGTYLINGFYYDKNKFELVSQPVISTTVRDINVYKLKYKLSSADIYLNVIIAHLKAGSSESDIEQRRDMVQAIFDWLSTQNANENFIIAGDFNVTSSSEPAFQLLINPNNPSYAFYDPVNKLGQWNNNYGFRHYHTQSTHEDFDSDCHSGGGLDDRFDFVLINASVKDGTAGVKYKEGSYWAVGQDGMRFNMSINDPVNTTLPEDVINALYHMSDHLPVVAEFSMGEQNSIISLSSNPDFYVNVDNPACDNINFVIKSSSSKKVNVYIYDITGKLLKSRNEIFSISEQLHQINVQDLYPGIYILNFRSEKEQQTVRLVKTKCE